MANEGAEIAQPNPEQVQRERLEIVKHRNHLTSAIETALGDQPISRTTIEFYGAIGGAEFNGLRLAHMNQQTPEGAKESWRVVVESYYPSEQVQGSLIDMGGENPGASESAKLEFLLQTDDPNEDHVNIDIIKADQPRKRISRKPTLEDYRIGGIVADEIEKAMRTYGKDIFQTKPDSERDQDFGNPFGPLPPKDHS